MTDLYAGVFVVKLYLTLTTQRHRKTAGQIGKSLAVTDITGLKSKTIGEQQLLTELNQRQITGLMQTLLLILIMQVL